MVNIKKRKGLFWKLLTVHTLSCITAVFHIGTALFSLRYAFFSSEDALMSMVSSFAEIIAGLYGTTLAGYTFFLSRIDGLMASDTTLDFVVTGIKRKFKYLIWHITFNVLMTLLATAALMLLPAPETGWLRFLYRLACNEFIVFLGFSVVLILWYSLLVINPKSIEKEAAKQKKRLSPEPEPAGSTVEFFSLYGRIQETCEAMVPTEILNQIRENKGNRFLYTLALLPQLRPDLADAMEELERIHHYYVCTLNCTPLTVSQEICAAAEALLERLTRQPEKEAEAEESPEDSRQAGRDLPQSSGN